MMHRFSVLLLLFATFAFAGCTESIDSLCGDVASRQCERCETCIAELDSSEVTGNDVCGIEEDASCVSELRQRCQAQSSTLEEPKDDLEACIDSLGQFSCEDVLRGYAQDSRTTTYECSYFL